jgi:hypothetical protein
MTNCSVLDCTDDGDMAVARKVTFISSRSNTLRSFGYITQTDCRTSNETSVDNYAFGHPHAKTSAESNTGRRW